MTKAPVFIAMALATLCVIPSCEKLDFRSPPPDPITKNNTVDASIKQDATYTYSVAAVSPLCTSQITTDAQHASTSKLTTDANGNATYSYSPAANYAGTEQVVVTMSGAQNNGSNPNTDGKETIITTFNITVEAK